MEHYVRDKLRDIGSEYQNRLVETIVYKVSGIFLWVALVVQSIREGLENDYTFSDLQKYLETLPDELETLFDHLLKSVRKSEQKRAHETFSILLISTTHAL